MEEFTKNFNEFRKFLYEKLKNDTCQECDQVYEIVAKFEELGLNKVW